MNKPKRTPLAVQARHAKTIKVGQAVIVRDDNGNDSVAQVTDEPWCLGGHTYVVNCANFERRFSAYSVMRVRAA